MNKFLTVSLFAVVLPFATFAAPTWLAINTEAYSKDTAPSEDSKAYSAYFFTAATAEKLFGGKAVADVTSYLSMNFSTGKTALQENDAKLRSANDYVQTFAWDTFSRQYVFTDSFLDTLSSGEYLTAVLYQNGNDRAVRVLGNAEWTGDNVTFDSQAGGPAGTVGEWTVATVPEPTSGLMLLFGIAGLALRRKQRG